MADDDHLPPGTPEEYRRLSGCICPVGNVLYLRDCPVHGYLRSLTPRDLDLLHGAFYTEVTYRKGEPPVETYIGGVAEMEAWMAKQEARVEEARARRRLAAAQRRVRFLAGVMGVTTVRFVLTWLASVAVAAGTIIALREGDVTVRGLAGIFMSAVFVDSGIRLSQWWARRRG